MKKHFMIFLFLIAWTAVFAQEEVNDQAIRYQSQRMVFQQWDQNKFKPGKGFLDTNPYYWLVWGLTDPDYHSTDLRPLSALGPQTQRIALVAALHSTDAQYKLHADTVKNTAFSQITAQTALLSDTDPLWLLYYKEQFEPLLNYSAATILGSLPPAVSTKLISEGLYSWYRGELGILKERLQGARSADMDRGARILAYFHLLKDYLRLSAAWNTRTSAAQRDLQLTQQQRRAKAGQPDLESWSSQTDVGIAGAVLANRKY